jgi:parvulin-like peptidyl-prolyl isomerase
MDHSSAHRRFRGPAPWRTTPLRLLGLAAAALVVVVAAAMLLAACGGEANGTPSRPAVVALVDGRPVTQADVDLALAEQRLAGEAPADAAKAASQALREAIDRAVVRAETKRLGITVSGAEIDARVAQLRDRLGGEQALEAALKSKQVTREQLRAGSEYGLLRQRLGDAKFKDKVVSETAVRRFYERHQQLFTQPASVRLGMILFHGVNAANGVHEKIVRGKAFDEMARIYSQDPLSKENGGMLGWVLTSSLPAPLADAVAKLKPGELSDVVVGPGGWYVLKLYGRRAAETTPFQEVQQALRDELNTQARLDALKKWISAARKRADVEIVKS